MAGKGNSGLSTYRLIVFKLSSTKKKKKKKIAFSVIGALSYQFPDTDYCKGNFKQLSMLHLKCFWFLSFSNSYFLL